MIYAIRITRDGTKLLQTDHNLSLRQTLLLNTSQGVEWVDWSAISKSINYVREHMPATILEGYTRDPLAGYADDASALTNDILALERHELIEVARYKSTTGALSSTKPATYTAQPKSEVKAEVEFWSSYKVQRQHRVRITREGTEILLSAIITRKQRAMLEAASRNVTLIELATYVRRARDTAFYDGDIAKELAFLEEKGYVRVIK